jgi:hypothetical protein
LNEHYLQVKAERVYSIKKQTTAEVHPEECIYVSLDGTDQLGYGYPHFFMTGKEEKERIKAKIMVGCVPGFGVFCYDHLENVAGDPNLVIECLMRILKAVEAKRGKLARTLYLQFDNCPRENKNTYLVAFCSWLVQRGVFDMIEMSFLPVGHTHNECDQVASRISLACRHSDILTRDQLMDVMEQCYTPTPIVQHLDAVADFKSLINPEHKDDFSGISTFCPYLFILCLFVNFDHHTITGSHVHRVRGVSAPLHYKFQKVQGSAEVRTKMNVQQPHWSATFSVWRFPPKGRQCSFGLSDMGDCVYRHVKPETIKKIQTGIETCRPRMNGVDYESCLRDLAFLADPPQQDFAWPDGGVFKCELEPERKASDIKLDKATSLTHTVQLSHLREHPRLWSSIARMAIEREEAKDTTVPLTVGDFVAIGMNYDVAVHTIPKEQQREFWVGKLIGIYRSTDSLQVHWYHTAARQRWIDGVYRVWSTGDKTELVPMTSVWAVWSNLDDSNKIPYRYIFISFY